MLVSLLAHRFIQVKGRVGIVDQQYVDVRWSLLVSKEAAKEVDLLDDHRQSSLVHNGHDPLQFAIEHGPSRPEEQEVRGSRHLIII